MFFIMQINVLLPVIGCPIIAVEVAKEHKISFKVIHVTSRDAGHRMFSSGDNVCTLFKDGRFLTQGIQSDKKFLALAKKRLEKHGVYSA